MPMSETEAKQFIDTAEANLIAAAADEKSKVFYRTWRSHTLSIEKVLSAARGLITAGGRGGDLPDFERYVNSHIHEGNYTS